MSPEFRSILIAVSALSSLSWQSLKLEAKADSFKLDSNLVADAPDSLSIFLNKLNAQKKQDASATAPTAPPSADGTATTPGSSPALAPNTTPPANQPNAAPAGANPPDAADAISPENLKRLQNLESQYFFQQYPTDTTEVRLSRLEKFVFGEVSKGTLEERLTTLEQSLSVRDPSTGKPIIVQPVPKPAAPQANGAMPPPVMSSPTPATPSLIYPDAIDPSSKPAGQDAGPPAPTSDSAPSTGPGANGAPQAPDAAPLHVTKAHFAANTPPDMLIHQLNVAIQDSPAPGNLYFQRAKAEIQLSRWDAALNDLSNSINDIPNNAEAYLARALVQHKLGNGVLAGEDIKQARFYNPKLPKKIDFDDPGVDAAK